MTRVVAIWAGPPIALIILAASVHHWAHIAVPPRLSAEARTAVVDSLHASLGSGEGQRPEHAELSRDTQGHPIIVTAWLGGHAVARSEGRGRTLADAVADAGSRLREVAPDMARQAASLVQLKVDVVVGRGPLVQLHPLIQAVALHPGVDGLGAEMADGRQVYLLADDLISRNLLLAGAPVQHVDFRLGVDYRRAAMAMAGQERMKLSDFEAARRDWFRFRADSFVEAPRAQGGPPLPLTRGAPPRPELTPEALRKAALAGGHYLVAHLGRNGRYVYEVDLASGRGTNPLGPGPYSIPRHAGTTYFLAELYRLTRAGFLREPIERAFGHLRTLIDEGGCRGMTPEGRPYACVVDQGQRATDLGSTALTVVALVEYQRATGKGDYAVLASELAEFVLWMQRPDGSFTHRFVVAGAERDESAYLLYYSGEAALALARMYEVTGDTRYRDAAEKALDHLVGFYDFFLGSFFYGEEHWTCIAAEALSAAVNKAEYRDFCHGYGRFLRAQQLAPGDFPGQDDLAGSYMFTPFAMPQNTPTGSRTESMLSAYLLGKAAGEPDAELLGQIEAAMAYSLGQQIRPEFSWFVDPRSVGDGAISTTPTDRMVRIDYVQHVGSAMIRTAELLESL